MPLTRKAGHDLGDSHPGHGRQGDRTPPRRLRAQPPPPAASAPGTRGVRTGGSTPRRIMSPVMRELPTGTVTFLFTDIEGSTRLLHEFGPETYAEALAEHR